MPENALYVLIFCLIAALLAAIAVFIHTDNLARHKHARKHPGSSFRILVCELLSYTLWIFILNKAISADSSDALAINSVILICSILFGILLIRSLNKEDEMRGRAAGLNDQLAKLNEHLRMMDQQKTEFVSLASHQLRGPLTAIKGYASLLLEGEFGKVSKEVKQPVERILRACESLVLIVNDFLDVTRIEAGSMRYVFTHFSMRNLVEEVLAELQPTIKAKKLYLKADISDNEHFCVHADRNKIKQVLMNLVDNATKYTLEGGITVSIKEIHISRICVIVSDTGIGINPSQLDFLFKKFIRGGNANSADVTGTGLGLYVAEHIIDAHKGKIWAESEGEGEGSTFYLELPTSQDC